MAKKIRKTEATVKKIKTATKEPEVEAKSRRAGVGVISTIIESIKKKSLTKAEILEILVSKFPDRKPEGMKATVSIQLGPTRLGSKYKLVKDGDRYHIEG